MKLNIIDSTITRTYTIGGCDGFMIDIVDHGGEYEAFIYHEDYGIKSLMFGCSKTQKYGDVYMNMSLDEFKDLVISNLETENYIQFYINDYMED